MIGLRLKLYVFGVLGLELAWQIDISINRKVNDECYGYGLGYG